MAVVYHAAAVSLNSTRISYIVSIYKDVMRGIFPF